MLYSVCVAYILWSNRIVETRNVCVENRKNSRKRKSSTQYLLCALVLVTLRLYIDTLHTYIDTLYWLYCTTLRNGKFDFFEIQRKRIETKITFLTKNEKIKIVFTVTEHKRIENFHLSP